jgi:glycosyltransferase involved in cell wall biosynthesis
VQSAGYLKRFITGYFDRREPGIDSSKVKQVLLAEAVGQLLWRLPGAGTLYFSYLIHNDLYDLLARRHVVGGDIFHVFNHFGLHSMRKAKRLGMITLVERSAAHPIVAHRELRKEYAKFGLRFPASSRLVEAKAVQEFEEADAIFVPSEFVQRTMIEEGIPPAKLRRVHLGFSPERFSPDPSGKSDSKFRVLFVGTISLQKGVQYLLEAFRRLNLPNAELVLVGSSFQDSASFLPQYEGHYRHVPFVPHNQLPALYNSASVFVLPSLQDGFGMVVYEAAACGLPLIITDHVGAEIRDGQDGFVVGIRNVDELADRILRLYEDHEFRRAMGDSARMYIQRFTWQAYHQELADHYRKLLGSISLAGD